MYAHPRSNPTLNSLLVLTAFCLVLLAFNSFAGGKGDMPDFNHMPRGAKNVNQIGVYAEGNAKAYGGKAIANGGEGGIGVGGIGIGGQGGIIQPGAVRTNATLNGGSTTVSGVGNTNYNVPRQVAPIVQYGYGSSSDDHCGASFGINGGAPGGNGGLLFPWTEDHCKRLKASRHFMHELGMPKTACYRFVQGDDDNEEALSSSGESCNNVKQMYVAEPVSNVVPVATPTLDSYVPREEFNRKLDNAHRLGAMK